MGTNATKITSPHHRTYAHNHRKMKEKSSMASLTKSASPNSKAASRMSAPLGGKVSSPTQSMAVTITNSNGISNNSGENAGTNNKANSPSGSKSPTESKRFSPAGSKTSSPPSPSSPTAKSVSSPISSPTSNAKMSTASMKLSSPTNSKLPYPKSTKVSSPTNAVVMSPTGNSSPNKENTPLGLPPLPPASPSTSSAGMEARAATNGLVEPEEKTIATDSLNCMDISDSLSSSPARPGSLGDNLSRPGSSMSIQTVISPTDSVASSKPERTKMTVGEIVQQIESKSANLLKRDDFTKQDTLADLHFLAQQSRYNSDMNVKRKLVSKMVENGMLEIFIRVYRSVHAADYLRLLSSTVKEIDTISENSENIQNNPEGAKSQSVVDLSKNEDTNEEVRDDQSETRSISGMDDLKERRTSKFRMVPDCVKNFRSVISMTCNVTEKSSSLCEDCLRKGVIQMILSDLVDPRLSVPELRDATKMNIVKGYLGILSNIIRYHSDAREYYRECGAVKVLQHYLKSNLLLIKTRTIMLLSYIINETENDIINANDKNISLLVKVLNATLDMDNHYSRKYGYWAVEILAGLNRLGTCDSNKDKISHRGALPLYARLLASTCTEEEQLLAAQGFWIFAFHPEVRKAIRDEPGVLEALEGLSKTSSREEIRRTSKGAMWVIMDKGTALYKASLNNRSESSSAGPAHHVMLSYQWSSKVLMMKIRDRLRTAGYKVWMDVDHLGASLESMSEGVDKAAVVLICMSQKYKDSPSSRTESELSVRMRHDIVPLRVQPRYNPDGWLGYLVGTKLSFDFSREENFDVMMSNLVRELGTRGRIRAGDPMLEMGCTVGSPASGSRSTLMASQTSLLVPSPIPDVSYNKIMAWTSDDVTKWLTENGLPHVKEKLKHLNGELLFEVRRMQRQAPESFYTSLKTDLGMDFISTLKFTRALEKL